MSDNDVIHCPKCTSATIRGPKGERWCPIEGCDFEAAAPEATDMVNHPPHYTEHPSGVECIVITRHMGFNLGNALKYIWRADLKDKPVEDLKKAIFYLEDEIKKRGE